MQRFLLLGVILMVAACATPAPDPLEEDLPEMGDFRLAFNIVVAENMQQVPPSRGATEEEWIEILTAEIDRRFGAYEGERLYHIALAVDGYSLAPPGIPLLISPKSILVVSANVWDDEAQAKLHEDPNQITVFEGLSGATVLGSGLVRTREEQMQILARNMARRIQLWMLQNPEWFSIDPDAAAEDAAEIAAIVDAQEPQVDAEALAELQDSAADAEPLAENDGAIAAAEALAGADTDACVPTEETICPEPELPVSN
ncbi:MAG: hypothetical protein AAGF88_02845 [Pseudomonadota bacterium]